MSRKRQKQKQKQKRKSDRKQAPPKTRTREPELGLQPKREPWTRLAMFLLFLVVAQYFYLYLRPGGPGPVWVYSIGRDLLALGAFFVLVVALAWSLFRRPFLQPGRGRAFVALALVVGLAPFEFAYPSSYEGRPSDVAFRLPIEGEWQVFWGGEEKSNNRLARVFADQRWGLHLVRAEQGERRRGGPVESMGPGGPIHEGDARDPRDPRSYLAWGEPVFAPAAGIVVSVVDGIPDSRVEGRVTAPAEAPHGNTIVLEVAAAQYLHLTHLLADSIEVGTGEFVEAGAHLARVGHSGVSQVTPEPHLALFLSDASTPGRGEPIPWRFHDYLANGQPVAAGLPRGGVGSGGTLVGERVENRAD